MATQKQTDKKSSGNPSAIIVLVVVILAGVGALAFFSGSATLDQKHDEAEMAAAQEPAAGEEMAMEEPAAGEEAAADDDGMPKTAAEQLNIEEGNPVVAKLNGEEINRLDVFTYINNLPAQVRQQPVDQVFAIAQDQVINEKLLEAKSMDAGLENDPDVQAQLEQAKANIIRNIYLQNELEKRVTDERLQALYKEYTDAFQPVEEVKAAHILVDDEAKAVELIAALGGGADFATLAQENSKDGSAEQGGDLGYFAASDVVKPFGDAAFAMEAGTYSKTPVKSDFGFHIIKVEDKRMTEPESFDTLKQYLEPQLRQQLIGEIVDELREGANVELFDINGKPVAAEDAAE
jgi:peptidyl-prolyl cis-trans isomerase C